MRKLALLALLAAPAWAHAQSMDAGELAHALDRVGSTTRVLYIGAHPDDENTRLLAYLVGARHANAVYLSMTRGGGGQNLIGGEQGALLDVIRTEELLAARRIDGAGQRFTRMRDFGYSKSADETFTAWGHEEALADVVWVIRTFQPDVIIARFSEVPPNHGHHTASAILAREAFAAAADPRRFPEQLTHGVEAWQADRLLQNIASWQGAPPPPPGALELDVGVYDARLGLGYGEVAALSRSQHKSQGFGVPGERGPVVERFVSVAGTKPTKDIFEGLSPGWKVWGAAGERVDAALAEAVRALDRDHPERALPALAKAHEALAVLPDKGRVPEARRALDRVIAQAAGLYVRATAAAPVAIPGAHVEVSVELIARTVALGEARVTLAGKTATATLARNDKKLVTLAVDLPADAPVSTPYWLASAPDGGRYSVTDPTLVGQPHGPPALLAQVSVQVSGAWITLDAPVVHTWTDPVHGERTRAFSVSPPATVTPARDAFLFPGGGKRPVRLRVRAAADGVTGDVDLGLPAGWTATPATAPVTLAHAGDELTVAFEVTPPAHASAVTIHPAIRVAGKAWSYREDTIDYPHIPRQLVLAPATTKLVPLELRLPRGTVGYVRGSGDSVAEDLAHVGVKIEEIDDETLRSGDLSRFAAIVVGIRAYNTREIVRAAHPRLMAYVERGGNILVQYNTNSRIGPLETQVGPCPLEISRDRVTDENAVMTPVDAKNLLLREPNLLTAADFTGWVQERGIYFAGKWDACYQPLFSMADPGEAPVLGSTLVARHGKGRYVYTGLVFFRQLPAGVPGAYRLLVNLIAGKP